jgi:serine/threonine protein kinase
MCVLDSRSAFVWKVTVVSRRALPSMSRRALPSMSRRALPSETEVWKLVADVVRKHGITDVDRLLGDAALHLEEIEETFSAHTHADKIRSIAVAVAYAFNKHLARAFKARTGEGALVNILPYALASALQTAYPNVEFDTDLITAQLAAYTSYKSVRVSKPHTSFGGNGGDGDGAEGADVKVLSPAPTRSHAVRSNRRGSERKTRHRTSPILFTSAAEAAAEAVVGNKSTAAIVDVPTQVGRFHIVRRLGAGTFGVVYQAHDPERKSSENVAIKVMKLQDRIDSTGMNAEQLVELSSQRHLSGHPNIVPIYEVVRSDDGAHLILVMPLARSNLADAIAAANLTPGNAARHVTQHLRWASDIACGLRHMHRSGLLHRDIKPLNVLIAQDGSAQLADFGMVRAEAAKVPSTYGYSPYAVGSLVWCAPELLMYDYTYDAGVDWWAFGWVLFELLFGKMPVFELKGEFTAAGVCAYLYENLGWPQRFRERISHSLLQRLHTSQLDTKQLIMRNHQNELLRWPAEPQTSGDNMLRHLIGDLTYTDWSMAYETIPQPTIGGGDGGDGGGGGREQKYRIVHSVWENARRALRGLLAIDPETRTAEHTEQLFTAFPCRAPDPKRPVSTASRNSFRDLSELVGGHTPTMVLATQIWHNLNEQTPSGQTKPEHLPTAVRHLWRLTALSLAAKDLEAAYPQLSDTITEQERRNINQLEPVLLKLVHEDIWLGFYRPESIQSKSKPKPPQSSQLRVPTTLATSNHSSSPSSSSSSPSSSSPRTFSRAKSSSSSSSSSVMSSSPSAHSPRVPTLPSTSLSSARNPRVASSASGMSLEPTRSRPLTRSQTHGSSSREEGKYAY